MDIELLGGLRVRENGVSLVPPEPLVRQVLALLAAHADQMVPTEVLTEELAAHISAVDAQVVLGTAVRRLRERLSEAADGARGRTPDTMLRALPGGYLLDTGGGRSDLREFAREAGAGYRAMARGDMAGAARRLAGGLRLWRGRVFEGVPIGPRLAERVADLEGTRRSVHEQWVHARLELDRRHGEEAPRVFPGSLDGIDAAQAARALYRSRLLHGRAPVRRAGGFTPPGDTSGAAGGGSPMPSGSFAGYRPARAGAAFDGGPWPAPDERFPPARSEGRVAATGAARVPFGAVRDPAHPGGARVAVVHAGFPGDAWGAGDPEEVTVPATIPGRPAGPGFHSWETEDSACEPAGPRPSGPDPAHAEGSAPYGRLGAGPAETRVPRPRGATGVDLGSDSRIEGPADRTGPGKTAGDDLSPRAPAGARPARAARAPLGDRAILPAKGFGRPESARVARC
ncbi:BTAD domain-containing putative transcriptional regulator [Streptomyces sp. BI20]|uniref:BTAD domain-containing putative transcriptional regulator n=1 Tax=Streptomyces sp. BI20 TaxID=3403460 RepID=UPI003C78262D